MTVFGKWRGRTFLVLVFETGLIRKTFRQSIWTSDCIHECVAPKETILTNPSSALTEWQFAFLSPSRLSLKIKYSLLCSGHSPFLMCITTNLQGALPPKATDSRCEPWQPQEGISVHILPNVSTWVLEKPYGPECRPLRQHAGACLFCGLWPSSGDKP